MPTQINGLPAHILLIHAVLALLPLATVMMVAGALWPAARARLGIVTPAVALIALVLVPVTTHAGEWLQDHLPNGVGHTNPLIRKHTELGQELLPWAAAVFVLAAVGWWLGRSYELSLRPVRGSLPTATGPADGRAGFGGATGGRGRGADRGAGTATATVPQATTTARPTLPLWANVLLAALSVVVGVVAMIQLYRIGDSGAHAVWHGATTG